MRGVVLCGGESTRMGSDKGLLKFRLNTWAQNTVDKITSLQIPVVISINQKQQDAYASVFSSQMLIVDNDSVQINGPLRGVLSVHLKFPHEDLLILACDMQLMETDILKELLTQYNQQANFDTFVYTNEGEPEPLCGIYKANGLNNILRLYQTNQLARYSIKYTLEQIGTCAIPLTNDKKKFFQNFNTQTELNKL